MRVDSIRPAPGAPRTATEQVRAVIARRRMFRDPGDFEVRLPVTMPRDHRLEGCPPAGAYRITPEPRSDR